MAYADQWTSNTDYGDPKKRNPAYPDWGNDCTNFVSQVLYAGGYPVRGNQDDGCYVWDWWRPYQIAGSWWGYTWAWSLAECQRQYFSYHPSEFQLTSYAVYLSPGDFLQMDQSGDGYLSPTHARVMMGSGTDVVTGIWYQNLINQHTGDRKRRFWEVGIDPTWPLWPWHVTY